MSVQNIIKCPFKTKKAEMSCRWLQLSAERTCFCRQTLLFWSLGDMAHNGIWKESFVVCHIRTFFKNVYFKFPPRCKIWNVYKHFSFTQGVYIIRWYILEDFVVQEWAELMFLCYKWSYLFQHTGGSTK
jgi:hypothetical protein